MKITHTYSGLSLKQLHAKYKTGPSGFWSESPWWIDETFADETPPKGQYELIFDKSTTNKTYAEQLAIIPKGYTPNHIAIITEAILEHYKKTKERICEDWYVRSSALGSGGGRVGVGRFGAEGLSVGCWGDDRCDGHLGVASSRKIGVSKPGKLDPLEFSNLESRVKALEDWKEKIIKAFNE